MKTKHIVRLRLLAVLFFFLIWELGSQIDLCNRLRCRRSRGHEGDAIILAAAGEMLTNPTELLLSHRFILATVKGTEAQGSCLMLCITVSRLWQKRTNLWEEQRGVGQEVLVMIQKIGHWLQHLTSCSYYRENLFHFYFYTVQLCCLLNHLFGLIWDHPPNLSIRTWICCPDTAASVSPPSPYCDNHRQTRVRRHDLIRRCFMFGLWWQTLLFSSRRCYGNRLCRNVGLIGDRKLHNPLKVLKREVSSSQTADAWKMPFIRQQKSCLIWRKMIWSGFYSSISDLPRAQLT